jgi:hypothetical protein
MEMNLLIAKYLQKDTNMESAGQILERWRLVNEQYSWSARSTVHAIRVIMPKYMTGHTDEEIV